jgi:hypothetical protein
MNKQTLRILSFVALAATLCLWSTHGFIVAACAWLAFEFCVAQALPGCGVNTLGTLAASQVIVQEALDLVFTERPILNEISLDLKAETIAKQGQAVVSRLFTVATVGDFGDAATGRSDTDVSVTISNFKQVKHTFTAAEYNQTNRQLVRESARPIAIGIANHLVDAVAALWLEANYANETVRANGWAYEHLVDVEAAMLDTSRGLPDGMPRFYAANTAVYKELQKDPMIVAAQNNADNASAIRDGMLPKVAGFKLVRYPALLTTDNLVAFAGTKDSAVLAARIPTNPESVLPSARLNGTFIPITNEKTGFTVVLNEYIDQDTLACTTRVLFCYGVAKGNGNNGQRIVTS